MRAHAQPFERGRRRRAAKHRLSLFAVSGLVTILAATGCSSSSTGQDGTVTLRFADNFSTSHPITANGSMYFVDQVREKGPAVGLDVEFFPAGQLGKWGDVPTMLTSGIADVGGVTPAYLSAQMPLTSGFDLPGYTSDSCVGAAAVMRASDEGSVAYKNEIRPMDIHPLWGVQLTGYELMTTKQVTDPHSMRGSVLRSPGGAVDRVVDAIGGAGVSMPLADMYEAISRGTVDGTVASPTSMAPYGLADVLQYSTIGAKLGSVSILYSMSNEQWSALNDKQRAVVEDAARSAQQNLCRELNVLLPKSQVKMEQDGTTLTRLSPKQQAEWKAEVSQPAREAWLSDLSDMGLPAAELLAEWEAALRAEGFTDD